MVGWFLGFEMRQTKCECCYEDEIAVVVGFVGTCPSQAHVCSSCRDIILKHHNRMGMIGQISAVPIEEYTNESTIH